MTNSERVVIHASVCTTVDACCFHANISEEYTGIMNFAQEKDHIPTKIYSTIHIELEKDAEIVITVIVK